MPTTKAVTISQLVRVNTLIYIPPAHRLQPALFTSIAGTRWRSGIPDDAGLTPSPSPMRAKSLCLLQTSEQLAPRPGERLGIPPRDQLRIRVVSAFSIGSVG